MPSRFEFRDFQVLWWKFTKFLLPIFGRTSQFSFKRSTNLECNQRKITPLYLFSWSIYFGQNQPIKSANVRDFWVLGKKFVKFLMSISKWQVNYISNFASFFFVITHNSAVNFKLIHFLLRIKGFNDSPNFENFMCSGENLPNSSCHFPNLKSVFLQILHHTLVSWNKTPLYFFQLKHDILWSK